MKPGAEWPIAVRLVDLGQPLAPLTGLAAYSRVRVFFRHGACLVGSLDIWNRGASTVGVPRLIDEVTARLGKVVAAALADERARVSAQPSLPPTVVSIVVPTCGRETDLRQCLNSLVAQRTRHTLEIIVVDNRPGTGGAARVAAEFLSVRLVAEPRQGLSYARNTGIAQATGSIIVATDDDVVAPEGWIERLVNPLANAEVMGVAGHVLPIELETRAQCLFEAYGGLGKGFTPRRFDGAWFRARFSAVPTWNIGATANAAFRASLFSDAAVGLLDEALGAGTPTGCSEDTYLFYRMLSAGHTIVYEPSAFVWHRHRRSVRELRAQIYAYSKGHVAYHLTTLLRHRDHRALIRLALSLPRTYLARAWYRLRRRSDYPLSLIALEIAGNFAGPLALWRSRRRVARLGVSVTAVAERTDAVSLEGQAT